MMSSMASRGSDSPAAMVSMPTGPPPKFECDHREIAAVELVEAERVDLQPGQRRVGDRPRHVLGAGDAGEIADPAQQPAGDARRAAGAARDLQRAVVAERHRQDARAAPHDHLQLLDRIEIEADRNAEAVAQRVGEQAEPRRRGDQREAGEIDLDRARRRSLADDQVELEILHRRIEDFLDRRVQPVHLVDEQHVAVFEIGEQRGEVAGLGDHRAGGRAEVDAELARHDLRQRRLAEAGRPDEQHMVERLAPALGRLDEHFQIGPHRRLPDELVERLRPQRHVGILAALFGGDEAGREAHAATPTEPDVACSHRASSLSPKRMSFAESAPSPAAFSAAATALAATSRE